MTTRFRQALVVGASSGIGEALARRLAASGARVALVARRQVELERVAAELNTGGEERALTYVHDVRHWQAVPELLQRIARDLGGLDLVVYAAGVMHRIAADEYDPAKDRDQLEVNLLGAVAWLDPAAARFGQLRQGTIVGIGSVAGDRGRSGNPTYGAGKAGLHTYLEGLRNRVARLGVKVVTIKPGYVDTAMTRGQPGLFWLTSSDRAAAIILRKAARGAVTAYVPGRWRPLLWVVRSIPSFLFRRLKV
jgi:decaprenylphospho-beta-D-erythro-pentofuranosid-2-ulose 2-reductase